MVSSIGRIVLVLVFLRLFIGFSFFFFVSPSRFSKAGRKHVPSWQESIFLMRASLSLLRSRPCAAGGHHWSNNPPHVEKIHRVVSTHQESHFQTPAITAW